MILAAGAGTRLRPLTETIPKALVPVLGLPMLERLAGYLTAEGVTEIAVNLYHLPEVLAAHLEAMAARRGAFAPIRLFREKELLGTGGGVANVAGFWGEQPLLVWNGDVLADVPPGELMAIHGESGALATLVTQRRPSGSLLLTDGEGALCGIDSPRRGVKRMVRAPSGPLQPRAFNGISVLAPALQALMARPGPFDLIDALLEAAEAGHPILGWDAGERFWGSTGTPEQLATLEQELAARPEVLERWTPGG